MARLISGGAGGGGGGGGGTLAVLTGEPVVIGQILAYDSAGAVVPADAYVSGRQDPHGAAKSSAGAGATIGMDRNGPVAVLFDAPPPALANGSRVYLGAGGVATLTPPAAVGSAVVFIGTVTGANGLAILVPVVLQITQVATN